MTDAPLRWQLKAHSKKSLESDLAADLGGVEVMDIFPCNPAIFKQDALNIL